MRIFLEMKVAASKGEYLVKFPYGVTFNLGEKQYFQDHGFSLTQWSLRGTGYVLSWLGRELRREEIS